MVNGRLLIVSNRLPMTARVRDGRVHLTAAAGGLASGLRPWHERSRARWIGWPGEVDDLGGAARVGLDRELRDRGLVPVYLSRDQVDRYYHGFANRVLWPLLHYLIDRVPVEAAGWDAYVDANEAFADVVARGYRAGDAIWVHDYQLMLLPALLRRRLPDARIGFFLHTPFPSSEVFRILPWREPLLTGLLGADLVGFHTFAYMRHFLASLLHVQGVDADVDRVRIDHREVKMGVFPMGIDAARVADLAADPGVIAEAAAIRESAAGRRIILGVDRLDYTKGIPRRLEAIERLFQRHPGRHHDLQYLQVAVPSRQRIRSYQRFRRDVEAIVGRLNGACGSLASAPVHYLHRSVSPRQLAALYRAADVMLVTPLRDGMNLVAKEFVASRVSGDGVLILSEFAGAAAELYGAIVVNPYDVDGVAEAIERALAMSADERQSRMGALRRRVFDQDVHAWASRFLETLAGGDGARASADEQPEAHLIAALARARTSTGLRVLLDYDGTLVPLAATPELAAPDPELMQILTALASARAIDVEIVSGRAREMLAAWFGHLPVGLWAEHGFWHRPALDTSWHPAAAIAPRWMDRLLPILQQFTESTPGSRLEIKSTSVAWHFRAAPAEFGARQAHELRMLLGPAVSNQPLEVLEGKKVIEVRWMGVGKAIVAPGAGGAANRRTIAAFGDDRTDEHLFRALPPSDLTIAVGDGPSCARYRLADPATVRRVLQSLAHGGAATAASAPSPSASTT